MQYEHNSNWSIIKLNHLDKQEKSARDGTQTQYPEHTHKKVNQSWAPKISRTLLWTEGRSPRVKSCPKLVPNPTIISLQYTFTTSKI
jgi:hypothetical protein